MLGLERGMDVEAIAALCDGGRFAPEPLTDAERAALPAHDRRRRLSPATTRNGSTVISASVRRRPRRRGDGDGAPRAVDLRVNSLKAKREKSPA